MAYCTRNTNQSKDAQFKTIYDQAEKLRWVFSFLAQILPHEVRTGLASLPSDLYYYTKIVNTNTKLVNIIKRLFWEV